MMLSGVDLRMSVTVRYRSLVTREARTSEPRCHGPQAKDPMAERRMSASDEMDAVGIRGS